MAEKGRGGGALPDTALVGASIRMSSKNVLTKSAAMLSYAGRNVNNKEVKSYKINNAPLLCDKHISISCG